ncbi:FAD:protein FMN transferase [Capillimicrobium parvum]|uniref:FAD:protein FMN transferase n=1 Tax=Capillimicrobium parvum TaxID=2884022 RepID=A0A9E6XYC0_9ACTN|nr:FAD:protein FMN transferase [Capillimicrobium parvum]UGS36797.1 FAD:protein FMN transferase [Capillimicrobium parvum]
MSAASAREPALGTTALVVTDAPALPAARAAVTEVIAAVDAACSRFRDDSELQRLNRRAGHVVAVSELLMEAIATALWSAAATAGAVDPTVGQAVVVCGYDRDFAQVAGHPSPLRATRVTGWRTVTIDRTAGTVHVPPGVTLDLGASAKALAADRAAHAAARRCATGVLVALGGDVAVAGRAPAAGWRVRVCEDHRAGPDAPGQTIAIRSGGVATSSTTVRRWRRGPGAAHHIVDPATGLPAREVWRTATVAAASCVEANAASTAAIIQGEDAASWLAGAGLPARLVAAAGGAVTTVGDWPAERRAA